MATTFGNIGDIGESSVNELINEAQTTGTANAAPAGKKDKLAAMGKDLYRQLSKDEKEALSTNSGKVHFLHVLGAHKIKTTRQQTKQGGNEITRTAKDGSTYSAKEMENIPSFGVVGAEFTTDIDLRLPKIPFLKDDVSRVYPLTEVEWQDIPAGSNFALTRVEALYMLTIPELKLNGYCAYKNDPKGVQIACRLNSEFKRGSTIPTPVFKFRDGSMGSIKEDMVFVDNAEGTELLPQYAEKFKDLYVVRAGQRTTDGMPASAASPCTCASLAIFNILQGK